MQWCFNFLYSIKKVDMVPITMLSWLHAISLVLSRFAMQTDSGLGKLNHSTCIFICKSLFIIMGSNCVGVIL